MLEESRESRALLLTGWSLPFWVACRRFRRRIVVLDADGRQPGRRRSLSKADFQVSDTQVEALCFLAGSTVDIPERDNLLALVSRESLKSVETLVGGLVAWCSRWWCRLLLVGVHRLLARQTTSEARNQARESSCRVGVDGPQNQRARASRAVWSRHGCSDVVWRSDSVDCSRKCLARRVICQACHGWETDRRRSCLDGDFMTVDRRYNVVARKSEFRCRLRANPLFHKPGQ